MKINIVLPPYSSKPVGGYRVAYEYANALANRGHEVSIVHPFYISEGVFPKTFLGKLKKITKFLVHKLPFVNREQKVTWQQIEPKVKVLFIPSLNEKYIPNSDVVIATAWYTANYVNDYSISKGRKYYLIQHYETWNGSIEKVNATWLYSMKKIVIAKWLLEVGMKLGATDMLHIPNAIDHRKFRLIKSITERRKRVAMLYHTEAWKGAADGIEALKIVKKDFPELEVVFFGVSQRNENIPEWIEYVQNPSQEKLVNDIYNNSAIYLCPSWLEGWGLPSIEAMACGCALISTDNGGVKDYGVDGETALISPPKDPVRLAENLLKVLKDDNLRIKLAEKGRQAILQFNYETSTHKLEKFLREFK